MTDFTKVDLTVASTRAGQFHSVGFDVRRCDWPEIKQELTKRSYGCLTIRLQEEDGPRDAELGEGFMWVWVVMTSSTPLSVVLYLAELAKDPLPTIKLRPHEYP